MDEKQAILGFTEFFKGITGNQNLVIPSDIAEKFGIEKKEQATTLQDIATHLRRYAAACGGEHHTPKEIEKYLNEVANEISEMLYQTTKLIEVSRSLLGISNSALELWERQNHTEWL